MSLWIVLLITQLSCVLRIGVDLIEGNHGNIPTITPSMGLIFSNAYLKAAFTTSREEHNLPAPRILKRQTGCLTCLITLS